MKKCKVSATEQEKKLLAESDAETLSSWDSGNDISQNISASDASSAISILRVWK